MSQTGNRKLRTLLLSVLCLVAWQCVEISPVFAQRRSASNSPPETPSQRWLPLPPGGSADLKQQVQWLQQLKGLLGTDPLGGASPPLPKFDPEQLKTLLDAMKQMSGGLPDGTQPPALNGVSPEQVSKALADPEMREQIRRMLDQFSRDGKLPQNGGATDSKGAPFPATSTERSKGTGDESPDRNRPASGAGQGSAAMPRAMQELLQRLAQQAGRQPNGVPPEGDPATGDPSEKELGAADSRSDVNRPSRSLGSEQRPTVTQPLGTTPPPGVAPSPRAAERPGVTSPDIGERSPGGDSPRGVPRNRESTSAPSPAPRVSEMLNSIPTFRDQPEQVGSRDPRSNPSEPRTSEPRDSNSAGTSSRRTPTPSAPRSEAKPPPLDVRSELEQQGFAQTLRKLVEQAREESLVASNDSSGPSPGSGAVGDGSSAGLEGLAIRMLDSFRKDPVETGPESPAPIPGRMQPVAAPSSVPPPPAESRSPLSRVSKAAGSLLSGIVTPPASRPAPVRSSRTSSSGATADSQGAGSRSTVGLLMLLAVLGLVWYFVPQLLAAISQSQPSGSPLGGEIQLADIRTRRDVVRAFHQYALRPATPAPTWWTHREVERQVADETPALQPAIQTLADLYERARYLPDDTDFTPDQIGTARRALEQCEHASESNHRG